MCNFGVFFNNFQDSRNYFVHGDKKKIMNKFWKYSNYFTENERKN